MAPKPFTNLRQYLSTLRRENDLVEIEAEVDTDQEIPEIHRRVISAGGPALLFKNVKGKSFPAVTNLFGTRKRVDLAFGSRPVEFIQDAVDLIRRNKPPSLGTLWEARGLARQALALGTKVKRNGPILEGIQSPPKLTSLPHLKLWPEDGGPFVTLGLVYTNPPEEGPPNLGIYRMQVYDDSTTGMHWQIGKGGGFHHNMAQERSERLPVSAFLGGPPALILSAIAPLPENVPEILLAGLFQGKKLSAVRDPITGVSIPSESEFALVGSVGPDETLPEGPFGDHYGYYSLTHEYPVFRCDRIHHRRDAIYPATVVGKPRQEDFFLGDYLQELLSPLFPVAMPSVVDLWSYGETGFHSLSAAVVKERYRREAMVSAFRILGEGQVSLSKMLLLTDHRLDLRDIKTVLEHILARCRWETDLFIFSNVAMDTLDYAGPKVNEGSKGVLMGLGDPIRELPRAWEGEPPQGCGKAIPFCAGCLVVGGPGYEEDSKFPETLAKEPSLAGWQLVVLADTPEQAAASSINFLWTAFTRFEPAADLVAKEANVSRNHIGYEPPIVLDARMKPWYPKEVFCDPDIAARVDRRWKEYFPETDVEMGSSDLAHLTPS